MAKKFTSYQLRYFKFFNWGHTKNWLSGSKTAPFLRVQLNNKHEVNNIWIFQRAWPILILQYFFQNFYQFQLFGNEIRSLAFTFYFMKNQDKLRILVFLKKVWLVCIIKQFTILNENSEIFGQSICLILKKKNILSVDSLGKEGSMYKRLFCFVYQNGSRKLIVHCSRRQQKPSYV